MKKSILLLTFVTVSLISFGQKDSTAPKPTDSVYLRMTIAEYQTFIQTLDKLIDSKKSWQELVDFIASKELILTSKKKK